VEDVKDAGYVRKLDGGCMVTIGPFQVWQKKNLMLNF
jgi:hypothetical protein